MPGIQKILHPTDFSEHARYAFESACALARDNHATLIVLHVMMPSVAKVLDQPLPDPLQPVEANQAGGSFPWPQASDPQLHVEYRLTEGDPADEVLRVVALLQCDLIVMGTHGRTGLGRLLTGSVAEEVLRKAPCPVLVIKAPPHVAASGALAPESTASPGELVDVWPRGVSLVSAQTRTLLRTSGLEVVRLVVRHGQEIPQHRTKGTLVIHCVEGRAELTALGKTQSLEAGKLLHLPDGEPYTIKGIAPVSLVLLTILNPGN
jgi:nucleotide-binding universal stress UspA family protein/quercetin dioxygenase-like cupin family protein